MDASTIRTRYFNRLTFSRDRRTVCKTSSCDRKLKDEISWYLGLPGELKGYTPEVISYSMEEEVQLTMEYINSPTLAEMYVQDSMREDEWVSVFAQITQLLAQFTRYRAEVHPDALYDMYLSKTKARITAFLARNELAGKFYRRGFYRLNDRTVACPFRIFESHLDDFLQLLDKPDMSLIHGDLCFSNILYDAKTPAIKLIDPRGRFGEQGIYGDGRYDMAKLRHSLSGYEHIVQNSYTLDIRDSGLHLHIPFTPGQQQLRESWDAILGDKLGDIAKIEALLFLSLLPLHREDPNRQLALYGLATRLMYDIFAE
ncbi:hypothetical protein [Paenibacillus sp. FJAT-26967]|uniref:hypothetical protein n=1 Tax=Paenibacillus sp. FJAT-26967 TaxID=1729690 RepID=UPI000838AEA3|nr:hypothetical protein [Paenibacillus sp. FJAT-26967]